jgi:hypothetical protein
MAEKQSWKNCSRSPPGNPPSASLRWLMWICGHFDPAPVGFEGRARALAASPSDGHARGWRGAAVVSYTTGWDTTMGYGTVMPSL